MFAHPLAEVRDHAAAMLVELREVIPAFLARVDQAGRGARWIDYLATTRAAFETAATIATIATAALPEARDEVTLTEFDPDGELKVVASALYSVSNLPDDQLTAIASRLSADDRTALLRAYTGTRANRRHKPGRAFERTRYRFDVIADYGAFRDLQRHRLLTLEWQPLSTRHGYVQPAAIEEVGALDDWRDVMDRSADLLRHAGVARAERRRALRGLDGLPRPLLHGHERPRGDARHRAAGPVRRATRRTGASASRCTARSRMSPATGRSPRRCSLPTTARSSSSGCSRSGRSNRSGPARRLTPRAADRGTTERQRRSSRGRLDAAGRSRPLKRLVTSLRERCRSKHPTGREGAPAPGSWLRRLSRRPPASPSSARTRPGTSANRTRASDRKRGCRPDDRFRAG